MSVQLQKRFNDHLNKWYNGQHHHWNEKEELEKLRRISVQLELGKEAPDVPLRRGHAGGRYLHDGHRRCYPGQVSGLRGVWTLLGEGLQVWNV